MILSTTSRGCDEKPAEKRAHDRNPNVNRKYQHQDHEVHMAVANMIVPGRLIQIFWCYVDIPHNPLCRLLLFDFRYEIRFLRSQEDALNGEEDLNPSGLSD
jgi:hypothetical protein